MHQSLIDQMHLSEEKGSPTDTIGCFWWDDKVQADADLPFQQSRCAKRKVCIT